MEYWNGRLLGTQFIVLETQVVFTAAALVFKDENHVTSKTLNIFPTPLFGVVSTLLQLARSRRFVYADVPYNAIRRAVHDVETAAVGFPAGNSLSKVPVGISEPAVSRRVMRSSWRDIPPACRTTRSARPA